MENIAVVDWFTKERTEINYPGESDEKLDRLLEEIIKGFNGNNLGKIADNIYELLKNSDFYNSICSESRLPVCSLFHHSKNTAGIAVCLAVQKSDTVLDFKNKCLGQYGITADVCGNYSDRDFTALIRIASLLHDIGKPRSYTQDTKGVPFYHHTTQTEEIVGYILEKVPESLTTKYELKKILPKLAAKHHSRDSETVLEKIIGQADSVASAADRVYEIKGNFENDYVSVESHDKIFPHEINFDRGDLQCIEEPHSEILGYRGKTSKSVKSKLKPDEKTVRLFIDSVVGGGTLQYKGTDSKFSGSIGLLALDIMQIQDYIKEAEKLPMLRGGSAIVEDTLYNAGQIISKEVCEEAILFKGGGNLLAFVPSDERIQNNIKEKINKMIHETSSCGLKGAVATKTIPMNNLKQFDEVLKDIQDDVDVEKNKVHRHKITKPIHRDDICPFCFKRNAHTLNNIRICEVCSEKEGGGKEHKYRQKNKYVDEELLKRYKLHYPMELQHIGESIAVIAIDGNMMGRLFTQTLTPAEYNYKSEFFDENFKSIIRKTISDFISNDETGLLIKNQDYAGIDPLFVGGDDMLLIINAKAAIKFSENLIKNIHEGFKFQRKFFDGTLFENPTVTISCGIAIADAKFPIYFLLDEAKKMESKAKEAFRKKTETDKFNIIKLPAGSIAFTAVSGAMPSKDNNVCFVLPDNENEIRDLNDLIAESLSDEKRTLISGLITCGTSEVERLNFIKSNYASGLRKKPSPEEWLDNCEWMVRIFMSEELLKSAKMIIPKIWHVKEGV
ncbi:MAG: HD domain-containing protein [Candidatus Methanoperedens sp.]|nr:HD domain-containing protein [Candidatus Methanoperedens sp.]